LCKITSKTFVSDGELDFDIRADSLSIYTGYNTTNEHMTFEIVNPGKISDFNIWVSAIPGFRLFYFKYSS
jgi:hypothetical protein